MGLSNLPPGADRVTTMPGHLVCSACGEAREVSLIQELGQTYAEPEESPCCGAEWSEEDFEPEDPEEHLHDSQEWDR
jgi:hypothetical protein